jgi:hypothetical protein
MGAVADGLGDVSADGTVSVGDAKGLVSFGLTDGVGVDVETSIGVGAGVSLGVGGCARANTATKNAVKPTAPRANCSFRITKWERQELDERRLKRGFNQC